MEKGIYTLVLRLEADRVVEVGSLGPVLFSAGYYAYTGSARGPGGLSRVKRHMRVMEGRNPARRWHIDYLLPHAALVEVVATRTEEDLECPIARLIGERLSAVRHFGCTDCRCSSHLHFSRDREEILSAVRSAHAPRPRPDSDEEDLPDDNRRKYKQAAEG
ncbi:MAG TPA: GIY-YIG nuclease family protein [Methanothrix sp.]|nr:GIY-YIG nuclease family protein [Methanothrix sp.]